jgi:predicted secreted protein
MAAGAGRKGSVRLAATAFGTTASYSLTFNITPTETTGFGVVWKANISTIKDVAITVSGAYDKSDTSQDAAIWTEIISGDGKVSDLRLYTSSTTYWSGNAVLTGATISTNLTDKVNYSATFVGNGSWSYT